MNLIKDLCINKQKTLGNNLYVNFLPQFRKTVRGIEMSLCGENDKSWRGVPITEMYGSQSPWGAPEFPLVSPSFNHAVLYHVSTGGSVVGDRPPKPQIGHDKWDQDHVRMPCSSHSLYPIQDSKGETYLKKRWEMIETALSKPINNSQELADAILSYNTKFRSIWKFKGLHKLFNEYLEEEESKYFFNVTLPEIAKLALALPKFIQAPIPLLKQHRNRSVSLSQQQIASLLANAFFCTFPRRNSKKSSSEYSAYPSINFNTYRFYEATDSDSNMEKLKCICHYFRRVCTRAPVGVVTFSRRSVPLRDCPAWPESDRRLAMLPLHVDPNNTIEDASGLIQIDFANKFLGGGVLGHGCVQEEIRFVICPELMVSMLFTEVLRNNEALMIIGSERYSKYTGYGHTFQWAGDFSDSTPYDSSGRRRCAVLAIDAVPFVSVFQEFKKEAIIRELNKAWVGVSFDTDDTSDSLRYPGIATGNWGCGAFGGSPQLKSLLQTMVCAQARRPMAYYTFGDVELREYIVNVYNLLARYNVTVGELYKHLISFSERLQKNISLQLYPYLEQVFKGVDPEFVAQVSAEPVDNSMAELNIPETMVQIEDELCDSPDLFSQNEIDFSMTELDYEGANKETHKQTNEEQPAPQQTIRDTLFNTIKRMDESSSTSNSLPNPLLFSQSHNMSSIDSNASMNNEEQSEPATKFKKTKERKITDFFYKKPI